MVDGNTRMRRWYSIAGIDLDSLGDPVRPAGWIDVICGEAICVSSSNPSRQAIAYTLRDSVFANSTSDDRHPDVVLIGED